MKKILLFAILAPVLFVASFFAVYMVMSGMETSDSVRVVTDEDKSADDGVEITISAVGDCTLGSDISFGTGGTFDSEFAARGNDYSYFLSGVKEFFEKDDITIVNLEGPLSERGERADKEFAFRGRSDYAKILSSSSVEAANIANNHSMDYGMTAYEDTIQNLEGNGIAAFGSDTIRVVETKGIRVGLIGTSALNTTQRTNFGTNMEKLKAMKPDIIVASFHWGAEKAIKANSDQIVLAHNAVDMGADLVIGHHPHVLQGIEKYKGKYIVYSLGNFCFGGNKSPGDVDTMIFSQTFTFRNGTLTSDENVWAYPCYVSSEAGRNNYRPVPASADDLKRIIKKISSRSSDYEGVENVNFAIDIK